MRYASPACLLAALALGCIDGATPPATVPPPSAHCIPTVTPAWDLDAARILVLVAKAANKNQGPRPAPPARCWTRVSEIETPASFQCSEDIGPGAREEETYLGIFTDDLGQDIAVSFRGSESLADWLTDAQTRRVDWQQEHHHRESPQVTVVTTPDAVHRGFFCAYQSVRHELRQQLLQRIRNDVTDRSTARLYFTGHSLGGALSILAALDVGDWLVDSLGYDRGNVVVYTFGAPRAMTDALYDTYRALVPNSWEVAAKLDPVPHFLSLRYTHTHNMAVLNSRAEQKKARIDLGDGARYDDCHWLGTGGFNRPGEHDIQLYTDRLGNDSNPALSDLSLSVDAGLMRMRWSGEVMGPCDSVAMYRGDPLAGGVRATGINTQEWALRDLNGTQLTSLAKGPRYYIGYVGGFDTVLKSARYVPETPSLSVAKSRTGFLRVHWDVGDEGLHDFVAVYDHRPSNGAVDDYLVSRNVFLDVNDQWTTRLRWKTEGRWVAYVTQEFGGRGAARILRELRHTP